MKPGFKTSEFWLAAVASIVGLVVASGAVEESGTIGKVIGLIVAGLASLGYSVSRGAAKKPAGG